MSGNLHRKKVIIRRMLCMSPAEGLHSIAGCVAHLYFLFLMQQLLK